MGMTVRSGHIAAYLDYSLCRQLHAVHAHAHLADLPNVYDCRLLQACLFSKANA